jgi:hypothetical protein
MALGTISLRQKPVDTSANIPAITNWNPVIGYMVYQDDISDLFYFKLILEVRKNDASGTLIAKIKQRRNGYSPDVNNDEARAFFDLKDIINSQLVDTIFDQNLNSAPFNTIHKLGANDTTKVFSLNGDRTRDKYQIQEVFVKCYQQYSNSADEVPTENATENATATEYWLAASLPLFTPRSTTTSPTGFIQGTEFNKYNMDSDTDSFLSDAKSYTETEYGQTGVINYVYWDSDTNTGDYHTLGFLNHNTNFGSLLEEVRLTYYSANNTTLSINFITNNSTNGGMTPSGANEDDERLLYYGCGTANLEAQTVTGDSNVKPSAAVNDGWAYYTIQAIDSGANIKSQKYYFFKQDKSCKGYKMRRLAWINSLGCYDYFNFTLKSSQTIDIERNNYETLIGTYDKSLFRYNNTQRGKRTLKTTAMLKETLQTDWINEEQAYLLEKLFMSKEVQIVENVDTTYTEGVIITDRSFTRKTNANDGLIQYSFTIEYANPLNTNS